MIRVPVGTPPKDALNSWYAVYNNSVAILKCGVINGEVMAD